ncbi:MAG: hypothetical protein O7D30_09185, partial [Rickettsia endosymbiont of Ixodes persulcatus]|nr:hypothetical protein [Rickettsia endosymbiont of Ixodes persulcatus]
MHDRFVYLKTKAEYFFAKMRDIIITDILYLIPCILNWFYHLKIKKSINHFNLKNHSGKEATLYQ